VTIVPELEMPGHCGAAIAAMPDLLRASPKHHATIDFARPEAVACMETLVAEMLDVFKATPWFHIGGDECDLAFVHENPDFPRACAREQVADPHALYCWFVAHMNDVVKRHGRKMLVWEGFAHGATPPIPLDVTVMVYESAYHLPDCLARDRYPIVNASWEPLYVVNDKKWDPAEIYAWDRFYWKHFIEGFPAFNGLRIAPTSNVLGAQMCAWEQPESLELPSLRERLAAMSERLWNPHSDRDFADFSRRLAITDRRLTELLATPTSK
jgi:hexosaminidase